MLKTRWPAVPIEDLCARVTSGGTPSRSNPAYYDGGTIPWIKTGELRGWYVDDIAERITPAAVRESSAKVFPAETVLLAMYGDGKTMGSVGLIRTPAATNQACCAMLADQQKCDPKFLMYSLVYFKPAILKLAISGAQRNLNGKSIKQFSIGAPPVEVQKRIASILSAYDDLIENNTRRIAILEEMARRIYEEWFVRFRFPGHEGVRMVDSELGLVPEGWAALTVGGVLRSLESGSRPKGGIDPNERGVPSIGAENIDGLGRYDYGKEKFVSREFFGRMTRGFVRSGDVLLYKDGAHIGKKSLFRDGFPHEECAVNEHVFILRPDDMVAPAYLFFWLDQDEMTQRIRALNANAAQPGINQPGVKGLPLLLPPPHIMSAFAATVEPLLALLFNLAKKNPILCATRDLLLPKLISGELDVSSMPEPEALAA